MTVDLITDLNAELTAIRAAKTAMLTNGQKHSLVGSHSFEGVDYKTLVRQENVVMNKLAALNGETNQTIPNFSGDNNAESTVTL